MSGGGCRSYRNANIDETDMLVGQLGHVSWTTRMLYASPPVTDNQPGSAEQPQGRIGVLLSAQCTMYNVQCTCLTGLYTTHRSNTYKSGTVCLHRSHCTKKVAQHNTAQHSTVQIICPNHRSSSYLSVLFRPPSDANKNWLIWFLSSILLRSNPREKKRAGYAINCFQ